VQILGEDDVTPLHYLAKYKKKSSEAITPGEIGVNRYFGNYVHLFAKFS